MPFAGQIGSVLQDLISSIPVRDVADEFVLLVRQGLSSMSSDTFSISTSLGQMGSIMSLDALKTRKSMLVCGFGCAVVPITEDGKRKVAESRDLLNTNTQAKYPALSIKKPSVSVGAKRTMLIKLQAAFPTKFAGFTAATFNPNLYIADIHAAFNLSSAMPYSPRLTLTDLFKPQLNAAYLQKMYNITKSMFPQDPALLSITTFNMSSIPTFGKRM